MGPLKGVKVVDLSERSAPAAIACMVLADYGARVVRVEPAHGDPLRSLRATAVWLRGQHSVTEDALSTDELTRLCQSADIVIDTAHPCADKAFGYRPPVPDHQVYCLLTAEPATAQQVAEGRHAPAPVYGELAEAKYGYMFIQDGVRDAPIFVGVPHAVSGAAWLIQIGVLGALYAQRRSGRGQVLTTSLVDGLAFLNHARWVGGGDPPLEAWPPQSTFTRLGNSRMILAMMKCSDGWIQFNTGARGASNKFFRLLGRDDLVDPRLDLNPYSEFADQQTADEFWDFMPGRFIQRTVHEWWQALTECGVSAMPILEPGESLALEQTRAQGLAHQDKQGWQFGLAWRFGRTPGTVGARPVPAGAHNDALRDDPVRIVANATGAAERPVAAGTGRTRGPLEGITVLDLGGFIAGPLAMRVLVDLGARVIKVEETSNVDRPIVGHSMCLNRGKESIAVDMRDPRGRELVLDLVRDADVVHHNLRFGAMERLGLGYEAVQQVNPRAIYCHASGYGNLGPWSSLPVFGPMPDALAGAFARSAGVGNPPFHTVSHADYSAALNSASAVVAGLVEREDSATGQFIETPQLGASMLWMSDAFADSSGTIHQTYPLDAEQRGHAPTNALYPSRDGWIVLACYHDREWTAAHQALGVQQHETFTQARSRALSAEDVKGPLATAVAELDTRTVLGLFAEQQVPSGEPQFVIPEMLLGTDATAIGPLVAYRHPELGEMFDVGRPWRFHSAPADPPRWPPVPGTHTTALLEELGIDAVAIAELIQAGVIAQSSRTLQAPDAPTRSDP